MDGEVVDKLWAEFTSTPAALVERAKVLTTP